MQHMATKETQQGKTMTHSLKNDTPNSLPVPGLYRHFKGNNYQVIDTVRHSETEELLVLYHPCYGEQKLWVRPLNSFNELVHHDGKTQPRFGLIEEDKSHDSNPSRHIK